MKLLFLPNWRVTYLEQDSTLYQAPDKYVQDQAYWFFRYFPQPCQVDIIDFQQKNWLTILEKKLNLYIWQGIKAFFKSGDYDVIISHGAQSALVLALLRTLTLRRKPIHIIFDIGAMNGGRNNFIENTIIALALKSGPYCICHSNVIIDNYQTTYQDLVTRSRFIPFGVDIADFTPPETPGKGQYVLSFGSAKRDYPTLLAAWQGLKTETRLRIIGLTSEQQVPNIEFIEKVSITELKDQIGNALFVVIPLPLFNYSYGQMSFLQSMSMGKTVVVTETPSSIDYLKQGEGAFLVKPYDITDLQSKLIFLLDNPEELTKSNSLARKYVVKHYSENEMAKQVFEFIHELLAKRGLVNV